jgi:CBS domain-containing protein
MRRRMRTAFGSPPWLRTRSTRRAAARRLLSACDAPTAPVLPARLFKKNLRFDGRAATKKMADNATRFLSAYNKIDKVLRNIYNFKANMTFTDIVRKSASASSVVRRYEDDLLTYSRLRNAIVHNSDDRAVVAEPHANVTEHIEYIARLLATPPRASAYSRKAVTTAHGTTLYAAVRLMAAGDYSNVPVIKDGAIIGVINNKLIVRAIAGALSEPCDLTEFLKNTAVASALSDYSEHYRIESGGITVDGALDRFARNRKLQIVILTSDGTRTGDIIGVLTTGDIMELNRVLDDY